MIEKGLAVARHGEFLIEAHLGCLKGELHLAQDRPGDAEILFREAFALASQGLQPPVARRAAALLVPLLTAQERHAEAAELGVRLEALQAEVAARVREIFAAAGSVGSVEGLRQTETDTD